MLNNPKVSLKKLAILTTAAIISFSAESFAESKNLGLGLSLNADSTLISNLPKKGEVTISGVVRKLEGSKKFILEDSAGSTIDVNTNDVADVKTGQTVTINGTLDSEFAGIGKQVINANISHAGLDLDSTRGHDLSFNASSDNSDKANDSEYSDRSGLIENLPEKGNVEISGIVSDVDGDNRFILKDSSGETIDVHTKNDLKIKEGDSVKVIGVIQSEALGAGEEIKASKIIKLSANF